MNKTDQKWMQNNNSNQMLKKRKRQRIIILIGDIFEFLIYNLVFQHGSSISEACIAANSK